MGLSEDGERAQVSQPAAGSKQGKDSAVGDGVTSSRGERNFLKWHREGGRKNLRSRAKPGWERECWCQFRTIQVPAVAVAL